MSFVRVGLSGCRRAVAGLPGPCGPYRSSVRPVRRLVDPLGRALRGSDRGKIWAGVGTAVGASWGTVVRVSPGYWPGDVACLALGS